MSAEHKRPLFAFVAVALVGAMVMALAARSDAMRSLVHREVAGIVAGATLDHVPDAPDAAEPALVPAAATPATPADATAPAPAGHDQRPAARRAHHGSGGNPGADATAHGDRGPHGKAVGHASFRRHGHGHAKGHDKTHGPAKDNGHARDHGERRGRSRGHR